MAVALADVQLVRYGSVSGLSIPIVDSDGRFRSSI